MYNLEYNHMNLIEQAEYDICKIGLVTIWLVLYQYCKIVYTNF